MSLHGEGEEGVSLHRVTVGRSHQLVDVHKMLVGTVYTQ